MGSIKKLQIGEAYVEHRPLLLKALRDLSKQGYAVPPGDGLDLIHDFFADAWPGLEARFDRRKAKFTTYLFGAFLQFARPRIVKARHWQRSLAPLEDVAVESESAFPESHQEFDLQLVTKAFKELPGYDQAVLNLLLVDRLSFRDAARRLECSRYRFRIHAGEALARLSLQMGEPGRIAQEDWSLAREIWGHGRSLSAAAEVLKMTLPQATAARRRIVEQCSAALSTGIKPGPTRTEEAMKEDESIELLEKLAADPRDEKLIGRIRKDLAGFLREIGDSERARGIFEKLEDEKIADVYAALVEEEEPPSKELQRLLAAAADDENEVTSAVEDVLLAHPAARRGTLEEIGLGRAFTAAQLFSAIDSVALLARRLYRAAEGPKPQMWLEASGGIVIDGKEVAPPKMSALEIERLARVNDVIAPRLLNWVTAVSGAIPNFFLGLRTSQKGSSVLLEMQERTNQENLFELWAVDAERAANARDFATA